MMKVLIVLSVLLLVIQSSDAFSIKTSSSSSSSISSALSRYTRRSSSLHMVTTDKPLIKVTNAWDSPSAITFKKALKEGDVVNPSTHHHVKSMVVERIMLLILGNHHQ